MKSNVNLRSFAPEDAEQVVMLLQDVSAYKPDPSTLSKLAHRFAYQKHVYTCVADCGGSLVGFGSLFVLSRVRGGRSAIIEDVVVSPDERGQGIGHAIIKYLLSQAQEAGCFKVSLESSEHTTRFYQSMCFEIGGYVMKYYL